MTAVIQLLKLCRGFRLNVRHLLANRIKAGSIYGVLLLAMPLFSQSLEPLSETVLTSEDHRFHGLSGLDVLDNGREFFATSDKGSIWHGWLLRDGKGAITGAENIEGQPILTSKGEEVTGHEIDAEGLDHDDDGNFYISFESDTRVSKFPKWNGPATLLSHPDEFLEWGFNSGPEAMCIGQNQVLWVSPERSGELDRPFPVWAFDGSSWRIIFSIPRKPPYLLVGMDYDPLSKRLFVLERDYDKFRFANRLRVFTVTSEGLRDEKTLWQPERGSYGNFEGISTWRDENNRLILTLLADDNFSMFFSNEIMEFVVTDIAE